jgi:hypothetical protein
MPYVGTDSCHPAGSLDVQLSAVGDLTRYRRTCDPSLGTAAVDWHDGAADDAPGWHRQAWVDRAHHVTVREQHCPRDIDWYLAFRTTALADMMVWFASTYAALPGQNWDGHQEPLNTLVSISLASDGQLAWLQGSYTHGPGGWAVALHLPDLATAHGAWQHTSEHSLESAVTATNRLRVHAITAANVERQVDLDDLRHRLLQVPSDLTAEHHHREHGQLFDRCTLNLGASSTTPVEDQLAAAADGAVPTELWQRTWALGRGLFIASSHKDGDFPPHLQGNWTGTWDPPWFGCYTNDENVQMMHWLAASGNLPELVNPLRRLIQTSLPQWRDNARNRYNCAGIMAPLQQGGAMARHQQADWQGWTGGAGWLSRHLWDNWLVTGEPELAEELFEILQEIIAFYDDFLEKGDDGLRHALPSVSVENTPIDWGCRWTIDATMEIAIVREVIRHALFLAEHLNKPTPDLWHQLLAELPAFRINDDGALAEWIHPDHQDNHEHRHVSHLYPLFPGDEWQPDETVFREAVQKAVDARLAIGATSQTGWSLVHLAHVMAQLGNGAGVERCLSLMLRACTQANLLTVHDDWRAQGLTMGQRNGNRGTLQLDALFGSSSAMQEALVQSSHDWLHLLPALLPSWTQGSCTGLSTRCGVTVDVHWTQHEATAHITATRPVQQLRLWQSGSQLDQALSLAKNESTSLTWRLPPKNKSGH